MKNLFRRFLRNEAGNVVMITALAILPILAIAGLAIDFQLTTTRKAKVQFAIDSAVLAATKSLQEGKSQSAVINEANTYFQAILNQNDNSGLNCAPLSILYLEATEELEGQVSCYQTTTLSQVAGHQKLSFFVTSAATYGIGKLEIAFVFDVSGSMANSSRMKHLKEAALEAVDVLLPKEGNPGKPEDVRLAMVSYDTMVNAGPYFKAATGEDAKRDYKFNGPIYRNGRWRQNQSSNYSFTSTCVWERLGAHRYTDVRPGPGQWVETVKAQFDDRYDRWTLINKPSTTNTVSSFCNNDIPVPLTYDRVKLTNFIKGMTPRSNTAGHIGTAWGWYLVSPEWNSVWPSGSKALPYDEPDAVKVVIIMSDGQYNQTIEGTNTGSPRSAEQAEKLCDSMKAKNIVIYTVGFNAGNGQDILNKCASNPSFAFKPTNGQQLTEAYKQIARSISDLRISR